MGWWARVKMEPKVMILKKDRSDMERSVISVASG
jgi:hypothetical protein